MPRTVPAPPRPRPAPRPRLAGASPGCGGPARLRPRTLLAAGALALLPGPARAGVVECVVAQVNGDIITLSDYERARRAALEELYRQRLPPAEVQSRIQETRETLLPSLIEERLLLQRASDLAISVGKEDVDRIVRSIMEQNKIADEATLERALRDEGLTVAGLRQNIERRTLLEKLKQYEIASKVVITDEEAKRYYEEHRDEFREPERVRLREVVLLTEKRDEEPVRREIEEIAKMVRNGADFAELATLFSQAPTAEHGGDLGLVRVTDLAPEIAQAASRLEPGQVSEPVRTKFGFHVLHLVERKPVSYRTFEEAREEITQRVSASRYGERLKAYVEQLRQGAFVQVNEACKADAS